ncbi:MAG: M14 family metallocarboxypeptidase [Shewanella sp.]|nr:M14 family metallocarboxypeptidase [Shewanella sp.]MCF1429448.1 M14 family metallocarboxypeptidase [Shewanella sp.]MCF1437441.1 M14 family metallocarboxypeptidase [Shewanella sp.]MCF1456638.1 M14 family metallocarboxypeptidase [Shewanella sp.]
MSTAFYPIGIEGTPWGETEKAQWLAQREVQRSYEQEVVSKVKALADQFELIQYGALKVNPEHFPLFALKSKQWDVSKPKVLLTGGVHGYETSGVQGAIKFAQALAAKYERHFNLLIAPCVSPWGYEVINRWNPQAIDPNRSFVPNSPAQESAALMALIANHGNDFLVHIDLHETTDSDEQEFRPALAARDGKTYVAGEIPDGFYLVGDSENPQAEFQQAMIDAVRRVTHIAPPDDNGQIIGVTIEQEGVINYPVKSLGLCAGVTDCQYCTTTEVYPDSPGVTADKCNNAQVAAVTAGLDYVLAQLQK